MTQPHEVLRARLLNILGHRISGDRDHFAAAAIRVVAEYMVEIVKAEAPEEFEGADDENLFNDGREFAIRDALDAIRKAGGLE